MCYYRYIYILKAGKSTTPNPPLPTLWQPAEVHAYMQLARAYLALPRCCLGTSSLSSPLLPLLPPCSSSSSSSSSSLSSSPTTSAASSSRLVRPPPTAHRPPPTGRVQHPPAHLPQTRSPPAQSPLPAWPRRRPPPRALLRPPRQPSRWRAQRARRFQRPGREQARTEARPGARTLLPSPLAHAPRAPAPAAAAVARPRLSGPAADAWSTHQHAEAARHPGPVESCSLRAWQGRRGLKQARLA